MTTGKGNRVALYCRVSTEDQAKMYGLDAQREALQTRAATSGYTVVGEFVEDGVSGALRNRPELNRLRELVRRRAIDRVLCPEVSRLARDIRLFIDLFDEWTAARVVVEFLGIPSGGDPVMTRHMLLQLALAADLEREMIRQRTHERGKLRKARGGEWAGGRWAYGYRSVPSPSGRGKTLAVRPEEAEVVVRIFEWYDAGWSLNRITRELNRRGVPTGRKARRWLAVVVRNLLRNPGYKGRGRYNVTSNPSKAERERNPDAKRERRPESEWLTVAYPPIVSETLFDRVQGKLTRNITERAGRPGDPASYLRGLMVCGKCGRRLVSKSYKRNKGPFRYYECPNRETACRVRERAVELEGVVWNTIRDVYTDPVELDRRCKALRDATAVTDVEVQSAVVHARTVVAKADRRVGKLVELIASDEDDLPMADLRARLAAAEAERATAREALRAAELRAAEVPATTPDELAAFSHAMRRNVRTLTDPVERAAFLRGVIASITVKPEGQLLFEGPLMTELVKPGEARRVTRDEADAFHLSFSLPR